MALRWLLWAVILLLVRCTVEHKVCSQVQVLWPRNTTSVCGVEVRLPLRQVVVTSLHLRAGPVSNATGAPTVLVEIGFAGDDTLLYEELTQDVSRSLSPATPVATQEVWLHFSVPVCFQLTIRGCHAKEARLAPTHSSESHYPSLRLARALASRSPEHPTPRPYSWLNVVAGGGATVLVLLVVPSLLLLVLCCNKDKRIRRDHKKLVSSPDHPSPLHPSPFHPSPLHKSAFSDPQPDSKSEFSYSLQFEKEHPLGSPTTSTFGVFRCDSLGVVRSNSVFTSPLLGSPGRQPLLQPSIHETSSYRAMEKAEEAQEDFDQSYSTSTMVIVGGASSAEGGAPFSRGETPLLLDLELEAPLHPVSSLDQHSPCHTSHDKDSAGVRVSHQPEAQRSPHQPCLSPDDTPGPLSMGQITSGEILTDGEPPQPCEATHGAATANSIEDQVYVHLHKCSPTAAAPEGAGPASEAAGEGNDEALGTALDDIMEGNNDSRDDEETSLDRGVRGPDRDAVVPIALRRSTRRRPRSDPHPYHTLEVPAPPLEEGGAVGCHICGQVTEQPPVGEPVYLELLAREQGRARQAAEVQDRVGLVEEDDEQEPAPAPTYHVLERQQLALCQDCRARHSSYNQPEPGGVERDSTPPPIPPRDRPPKKHTDPVYERVGSLNHRHLPLKLELSNSSHTYTTLKSEEGSYVSSAKLRGLLKHGSSSDYESVPSFKDSSSPYYHKAADMQEIVDMFRERMEGDPHPLPTRPLPIRPPPLALARNGESSDSHDYESLPTSFDHGLLRRDPEHDYARIGPAPEPDDLSSTSPPFVPDRASRSTLLRIDSQGYASIVQRGDSQKRHKYSTVTVNGADEVWQYQQENHYAPLTLPRRKKSCNSHSSLAYRLSKSSDPLPMPQGFDHTVPFGYEVPVVHHPPEGPVTLSPPARSPSASPRLERQKPVMSETGRASQDVPSAVSGDGEDMWGDFVDDVFDAQSMSSNKDPVPDRRASPGLREQSLASDSDVTELSCADCSEEGPPADRPRAMTFAGIQLEHSAKAAQHRQSLQICLNQQSGIIV